VACHVGGKASEEIRVVSADIQRHRPNKRSST
jgi:hypothetical protein